MCDLTVESMLLATWLHVQSPLGPFGFAREEGMEVQEQLVFGFCDWYEI